MLYVGIDLAERHSAAVGLTHDLDVVFEDFIDTGKAEKKEHPFKRITAYRMWWWDIWGNVSPGFPVEHDFVIEEPYPHAVNVAPSYRIQGALVTEMQHAGIQETSIRITQSKPWQDHFGYTKKEFGNSKAWAKLMCEGFGYEPGHTITNKKVLAKPKEDLRDAYLLARWLKET